MYTFGSLHPFDPIKVRILERSVLGSFLYILVATDILTIEDTFIGKFVDDIMTILTNSAQSEVVEK